VFPIPDNIEPVHYITTGEMYVMDAFQRHFLDLAIWSRALVLALKFKLPNAEDIYKRLLQEPSDMREIMATFFGLENAMIYENHLLNLITNFRHLTDALITTNEQAANESFKNLYQMADDMSEFFYKLNPSTSLDQWHSLLHNYVEMLYQEIYTIVSGNYEGDIRLFDDIIIQSYLIANYIGQTVLSVLHTVQAAPPATAPPAPQPQTAPIGSQP